MKTLYTGHITLEKHDVYSFIYAETLLEAEEYLTSLLSRYVRHHHVPTPTLLPEVKVVSRPEGWNPPDGYYLPGTSTQYALRYSMHQRNSLPQESNVLQSSELTQEMDVPQHSDISCSSEVSSRF
jgi:hypothetical protein